MIDIIEKIKSLYAELELKSKDIETRLAAIKKSEDSLQNRHHRLDIIVSAQKERESVLDAKDKEIGGAKSILERIAKLEEDEKELRRRQDILSGKERIFEAQRQEAEQEHAEAKNKLLIDREALDQERATFKTRLGDQVIADFLKKHGAA